MLNFSKEIEQILFSLEKTQSEFWNISRDTAIFLYTLARSVKAQKILEVGTSNGYSGIWLATALKSLQDLGSDKKTYLTLESMKNVENTGEFYETLKKLPQLITIESHAKRFALAKENFEKAGVTDLITQIKGHAPQIFTESSEIQSGNFDLVFLDATKAEHRAYLETIFPLVRADGLIVTDNILSHEDVMQPYVEYAKNFQGLESMVFSVGAGLLVSKKIV